MDGYIICNDNYHQDDISECYLNKYKAELYVNKLNEMSCGKKWYLKKVQVVDYEEEQEENDLD